MEITDERTGLKHDYTRKGGVDYWEILAPPDAPEWAKDPAQLWNKVEAAEKRCDAQLARELDVAIPRELTHDQARELVSSFVNQEMVSRGMIACLAFHNADTDNPHAHIMLTMRRTVSGAFGPKERGWNAKELLENWREQWANGVNQALEKAGIEARVDHRRLDVQAADAEEKGDYAKAISLSRSPQIHEGKTATAMRRCGTASDRGAINDQEKNRYRVELQDFLKLTNNEAQRFMHTAQTLEEKSDAIAPRREQPTGFAERLQTQRDSAPVRVAPNTNAPQSGVKPTRTATSAKPGPVRFDRNSSAGKKDKNELAKLEALEEWVNSLNKVIQQLISDGAQIHAQHLQRVITSERTDHHFRDPFIKNELQEILTTVQRFIKDDTRFSRREQSHARARAREAETRIDLEREQDHDKKPSAFRVQQNRDWKKRREKREQEKERLKQEARRAKRQLSPEKQAAYLQKANETGKQLSEQLANFEKRYPLPKSRFSPVAPKQVGSERTLDFELDQLMRIRDPSTQKPKL